MKLLNIFKRKSIPATEREIIADELRIMTRRLLFTTKCYEMKKILKQNTQAELDEAVKLFKIINGLRTA